MNNSFANSWLSTVYEDSVKMDFSQMFSLREQLG